MFEFTGEPVRVAGIDENGYGPLLGPLVVTRVDLAVEGDPWYHLDLHRMASQTAFRDSKEIFRRTLASYRTGEYLALGLLQALGVPVQGLHSLVQHLTGRPWTLLFHPCPALAQFYPDLPLPAWLDHAPTPQSHPAPGCRLVGLRVDILTAPLLNQQVDHHGSKALVDFVAFLGLLRKGTAPELALLGKIGGTRRYSNWFQRLQETVEVLQETRYHATYRWQGLRLHFLQNADARWLPVAMASVVGKYLRELFLLSLSRALGFSTPLPYASGYAHDARSHEVASLLAQMGLPESCFRRKR